MIDLNVIISTIETDLEVLIQEKKATITKDQLPSLVATPSQMNQLFLNLISNSLKFSTPATPAHINITARLLSDEEMEQCKNFKSATRYAEIGVADNGIGFAPEHAEHIFGLFKRLHNKTECEGTGIGLSLCKKITQNHGGYIYATSPLHEDTHAYYFTH